MLKCQLSPEESKGWTKIVEKSGYKVFDGSPEMERVMIIRLLLDEGYSTTEALKQVDKALAENVLIRNPEVPEPDLLNPLAWFELLEQK